ncbi:hypothetical protein BH23CHL2_BH23CHL2_08790 [soil metagenome]
MTTLRQNYQLIAAIAFVVGVGLITIAEMPSMHWTRVFGATAISLGALGIGVYIGLSQPGRYAAVKARLAAVKQPLAIAILVLLFLPALAGLIAGVVGLYRNPDGTGWVVATGGIVLVLMLVATAAAFAVGLAAVTGAGATAGDEPQ